MAIVCVTARGLDHIAEQILSYLDAKSLCAAELVAQEWNRVISDGMLWRKLIELKVRTDSLWAGLSERKGWSVICLLGFIVVHIFNSYLCQAVVCQGGYVLAVGCASVCLCCC